MEGILGMCLRWSLAVFPGVLMVGCGLTGTRSIAPIEETIPGRIVLEYSGSEVGFSPDSRFLAVSGVSSLDMYETGSFERIWTTRSEQLLADDWFRRVVFSPDVRTIAVGSSTDKVLLFDTRTGALLSVLRGEHGAFGSNYPSQGMMAWSPDGAVLAANAGYFSTVVWRMDSGDRFVIGHSDDDAVLSLAFSSEGTNLLVGSEKGVWFYALATLLSGASDIDSAEVGRLVPWQQGMESANWIIHSEFAPDTSMLASSWGEGSPGEYSVTIWETSTGEQVWRLDGLRGVWSPDGRRMASGTANDDGYLIVWDTAGWGELFTLGRYTSELEGLAWSPDGRYLASAARGEVIVWDIDR